MSGNILTDVWQLLESQKVWENISIKAKLSLVAGGRNFQVPSQTFHLAAAASSSFKLNVGDM